MAQRRRPPSRSGRLTREGKAFVFVTVGVGVAAVNTGNNLLYLMLGLLLSLLLVSMVLSEVALFRISARRRLPRRAFVGTSAAVELVVKNGKAKTPSYSLEVADLQADGQPLSRSFFLKVPAADEHRTTYELRCRRRGVMTLGGFRVLTRYPFGLVEKARHVDCAGELLVYPAVADGDTPALSGSQGFRESPRPRPGLGSEVGGIRAYRAGDALRSVHWRRTASLGQLVVKERELDASRHVTLLLDNARPADADPSWDDGFERAISEAAGIATRASRRGAAVEVAVRGETSPVLLPGAPADPLLRFLALLEAAAPTAPPPEARSLGARMVVPVAQPDSVHVA